VLDLVRGGLKKKIGLYNKLIWIKDPKGSFSVKLAYVTIMEQDPSPNNLVQWDRIWKLKIHERLKMFLWRVGANLLPTKERISQRFATADLSCILCNAEIKTRENYTLSPSTITPFSLHPLNFKK
jgi:hypothetical protein